MIAPELCFSTRSNHQVEAQTWKQQTSTTKNNSPIKTKVVHSILNEGARYYEHEGTRKAKNQKNGWKDIDNRRFIVLKKRTICFIILIKKTHGMNILKKH